MTEKPVTRGEMALRICVDTQQAGAVSGRIFSPIRGEPMSFRDLGDLVLQTDRFFDRKNFPQNSVRTRSFGKEDPREDEDRGETAPQTLATVRGQVATFTLRVCTRSHATWQGTIDWQDGPRDQAFKSTLDFLRLVDEGIRTPR